MRPPSARNARPRSGSAAKPPPERNARPKSGIAAPQRNASDARRLPRRRARRAERPASLGGRTWLVAAAVVAVAAVAGLLAGGASKDEPAAAPAASKGTALRAGALSLTAPAGWKAADDVATHGLKFDGEAATARSGAATITAGMTTGTGASLLPAAFRDRVAGGAPEGEPVRLGELEAYRYDDLEVKGVDRPVTVYAAAHGRGRGDGLVLRRLRARLRRRGGRTRGHRREADPDRPPRRLREGRRSADPPAAALAGGRRPQPLARCAPVAGRHAPRSGSPTPTKPPARRSAPRSRRRSRRRPTGPWPPPSAAPARPGRRWRRTRARTGAPPTPASGRARPGQTIGSVRRWPASAPSATGSAERPMELRLTVEQPGTAGGRDVLVESDAGAPVHALLEALALEAGNGDGRTVSAGVVRRTGELLRGATPVEACDLRDGDVLALETVDAADSTAAQEVPELRRRRRRRAGGRRRAAVGHQGRARHRRPRRRPRPRSRRRALGRLALTTTSSCRGR